jgi:hypothetical protein
MSESIIHYLLELAKRFGASAAAAQHHIGRDLGICGGDAVEFYREIERDHQVDLRPITEEVVERAGRRWWQPKYEVRGTDPTIVEIAEYIENAELR